MRFISSNKARVDFSHKRETRLIVILEAHLVPSSAPLSSLKMNAVKFEA